jgi:hypothetical protein
LRSSRRSGAPTALVTASEHCGKPPVMGWKARPRIRAGLREIAGSFDGAALFF